MSWEATAYVKNLSTCPDGAAMNRGQKLLALILADYHNTHRRAAWPSIPTLAAEALTSHAQAKRDLAYLEEHHLIRKVRPEKMGRGWVCAYEFVALDSPQDLRPRASTTKKRAHGEPLFWPVESGSEVAHREAESGSEVAQKGLTEPNAIRKNKELERQKQNKEHHACGAALKDWLAAKEKLQAMLPESEHKLWLRPMYLLKAMSGNTLLLALPPSGRMIEAAQTNKGLLLKVIQESGYSGFALTRYPDNYERERIREMFPDFYEQMFGNDRREEIPA